MAFFRMRRRGKASSIFLNLGPGGAVFPSKSGQIEGDRGTSTATVPRRRGGDIAPSQPHIEARDACLAPFLSFSDWLTPATIIRVLARFRLRLGADRAEADQWNRLFTASTRDPRNTLPLIFPPRTEWHAVRPKRRRAMDSADVWARALEYRMLLAIQRDEPHPWARNLRHEIESIRECALAQRPFSFSAPRVQAVVDEIDPKKVRIISTFGFRDRVILSLVSQYLSSLVDPFLHESSIAFRRDPSRNAPAALKELQELNLARGRRPLFVAECDIRSFFDALHHDVIEDSIRIISERMADAGVGIDPRVLGIVRSYLACYSFPKSVLPILPISWKKWPLKALQEFYSSPLDEPLGIPQGGALSNIIVNIVLDRADRALEEYRRASGRSFGYWRYCDDSLIVSPDRETCAKAYEVYSEALHLMGLPIHEPAALLPYVGDDKDVFWKAKTRPTYAWGGDIRDGEFPWIGFLGFRFCYDGYARLRPDTVRKVHFKMDKLACRLQELARNRIRNDGNGAEKRPSAKRLRRFLLNKVMASSFGWRWIDLDRPSKRSLVAWIGMLKWWRHDRGFLRRFDRHLGQLTHTVSSAYPDSKERVRPESVSQRWSFFLNFVRTRRLPGRTAPPRGNS